jgi:hypothetical protein
MMFGSSELKEEAGIKSARAKGSKLKTAPRADTPTKERLASTGKADEIVLPQLAQFGGTSVTCSLARGNCRGSPRRCAHA